MSITSGKLTFLFFCYFPFAYVHIHIYNAVVLYRIRSGQSQSRIYDLRDRDKPYKDSAQL